MEQSIKVDGWTDREYRKIHQGPELAAVEQAQREAPRSPSITINSELQPDSRGLGLTGSGGSTARRRCRRDRARGSRL
jgi:hypothetical protein